MKLVGYLLIAIGVLIGIQLIIATGRSSTSQPQLGGIGVLLIVGGGRLASWGKQSVD